MTSAQTRDFRATPHEEPWQPGAGLWTAGQCRHTALAPVLESTRSARDFTADSLCCWGLDDLVQDAVLIASELAANAIRHAAPTPGAAPAAVELAWWHRVGSLLCVVTDASSMPPVLAPPDLRAESGRGLQIVDALAAAWGWTMLGAQQKAVWAVLSVSGAACLRVRR